MIHFFASTKAQFINMAPVTIEMRNCNIPFRYIDSGQHAELTMSLRKAFGAISAVFLLLAVPCDVFTLYIFVAFSGWLCPAYLLHNHLCQQRWLIDCVLYKMSNCFSRANRNIIKSRILISCSV